MPSSSMKVHKAAICTSLKQLGRPSFSNEFPLGDIIKGASLREVKNARRVPAWDLFLVLSHLRQAPYEPLNKLSLKWLTLKIVFLIALATGRRCSEIHTLSGLPFDFALNDVNSYSLKFLPEFLAKNQSPD